MASCVFSDEMGVPIEVIHVADADGSAPQAQVWGEMKCLVAKQHCARDCCRLSVAPANAALVPCRFEFRA